MMIQPNPNGKDDITDFCEAMLNRTLASWEAGLLRCVVDKAAHEGTAFYKIQSQETLSGHSTRLVIIDEFYAEKANG